MVFQLVTWDIMKTKTPNAGNSRLSPPNPPADDSLPRLEVGGFLSDCGYPDLDIPYEAPELSGVAGHGDRHWMYRHNNLPRPGNPKEEQAMSGNSDRLDTFPTQQEQQAKNLCLEGAVDGNLSDAIRCLRNLVEQLGCTEPGPENTVCGEQPSTPRLAETLNNVPSRIAAMADEIRSLTDNLRAGLV